MPFSKGHKKCGGKKKGVPNRNKRIAAELMEKLGVDPFEILLHFAAGDWQKLGYPSETRTIHTGDGGSYEVPRIDATLRQKSAADAAQYVYAKLKAVEHSADESTIEAMKVVYQAKWGNMSEPSDDPT